MSVTAPCQLNEVFTPDVGNGHSLCAFGGAHRGQLFRKAKVSRRACPERESDVRSVWIVGLQGAQRKRVTSGGQLERKVGAFSRVTSRAIVYEQLRGSVVLG